MLGGGGWNAGDDYNDIVAGASSCVACTGAQCEAKNVRLLQVCYDADCKEKSHGGSSYPKYSHANQGTTQPPMEAPHTLVRHAISVAHMLTDPVRAPASQACLVLTCGHLVSCCLCTCAADPVRALDRPGDPSMGATWAWRESRDKRMHGIGRPHSMGWFERFGA